MAVGALDPSPPVGFSVAKSRDGGYRVFLPGPVQAVRFTVGQGVTEAQAPSPYGHLGWGGDVQVSVTSRLVPPGSNPGATPDELVELMKRSGGWRYDAPWYTRFEVAPATIGGRPGVEVRVKDKPDWMDADRPEQAREAKDVRSTVLLFTTDGKRSYLIELTKTDSYFEAGWVETVRASFTFL